MIGRHIAHYEVLEKIGEGGMGEVYRARDGKLGRDVALKFLPQHIAANPDAVARFRREAQLLASLNHSHIGAIFGLEEAEDLRVLVLELVAGPTLADRLRSGPMPLDESLAVARQIAEAIESAHEKGIVHRDLKPANIKLTLEGQVKVLDFGLAKALETDAAPSSPSVSRSPTITHMMTEASVILGTAGYMSPEQARGQAVDKRADIWAFGVILFEMLAGGFLFIEGTVSDTLASVLKSEPRWTNLPEGTPAGVRTLLRRCLQRDPRQRLRDIGDARIALDEALASSTETVSTATPATRPRRGILPLAAVGAVALVLGGAIAWLAKPAPLAPVPHRKFTLPLDVANAGDATSVDPAISPDGRSIAYTIAGRLWIQDLDRLEPREIPRTQGAASVFWSPDGDWLGYASQSKLFKVPRGGGEPTLIATLSTKAGSGASPEASCWTRDGRIVFGTGTQGLFAVSAQGGDPTEILRPAEDESDFHEVCILPEDRGFVFVVHRKEGYDTLGLLSGDGKRTSLLTLEGQSLYDPFYSPTGHILFRRAPNVPGIWAVPFSLEDLETRGEPFLVVPEGRKGSISNDGSLAYLHNVLTPHSKLTWRDRSGQALGTVGDAFDYFPVVTLSPDGASAVACIRESDGGDLWIFDTVRGTRMRATFGPGRKDVASWHPNGKRLYYHINSAWEIMTCAVDGTGEAQNLTTGALAFVTPDAKSLLFSRNKSNRWNFDIYSLPLDDPSAEPKPLVATEASEWWSMPSPDGRYMLYVSGESGRDEVYATTLPNAAGRWQVSTTGGTWPRWRRDGGEVYFALGDSILAVDVDTSSGFRVGRPRVLFSRPTTWGLASWPDVFDVSADGERFLGFEPVIGESKGPPSIAVAQNWFAEFESHAR